MAKRAVVRPGERFAKVATDRLAVTGTAAFRLQCMIALFTDRKGRLPVSRRYMARYIGRSTRTVRRRIAELRRLFHPIPERVLFVAEKTVRSTRKKLSAPPPGAPSDGGRPRKPGELARLVVAPVSLLGVSVPSGGLRRERWRTSHLQARTGTL